MSLRVAYINEGFKPKETKAPAKKKQSQRDIEADLWIRRQRQRNYDKACKEFSADIAEIQQTFPGWMPTKDF